MTKQCMLETCEGHRDWYSINLILVKDFGWPPRDTILVEEHLILIGHTDIVYLSIYEKFDLNNFIYEKLIEGCILARYVLDQPRECGEGHLILKPMSHYIPSVNEKEVYFCIHFLQKYRLLKRMDCQVLIVHKNQAPIEKWKNTCPSTGIKSPPEDAKCLRNPRGPT
ncbi:hypothetical protein BDB01DRAFT_830911 [Pilobolus umbonatus]|nr:hypothetical protein BDB01DRAFT_830911 [Pilobolus umbonatus]